MGAAFDQLQRCGLVSHSQLPPDLVGLVLQCNPVTLHTAVWWPCVPPPVGIHLSTENRRLIRCTVKKSNKRGTRKEHIQACPRALAHHAEQACAAISVPVGEGGNSTRRKVQAHTSWLRTLAQLPPRRAARPPGHPPQRRAAAPGARSDSKGLGGLQPRHRVQVLLRDGGELRQNRAELVACGAARGGGGGCAGAVSGRAKRGWPRRTAREQLPA